MNIKNQIRLSVVISLILAVVISASVVVTYQHMQDLQQQEVLAADVVKGSYELTYLANDYIVNAEPRARFQWEERYASLQPVISQLKPGNSEEALSIETIKNYNKKIAIVFREIPEPGTLSAGTAQVAPVYLQVTWSRYNTQSQGLIYEAWNLRHLFNDDVSDARFWNIILVLALMLTMLLVIIVNYLLISRRLVRSIREVGAGSEAFATGNLEYRIPVPDKDEIGEIAEGLNKMAGHLKTVTASRDELNREIKERKRAEEALRESGERFRGLFDTVTSGVAIYEVHGDGATGKDYIIRDFNKMALELERKTKDEVIGKSLSDLRPTIDEYGLIPVFRRVWKTGVPELFPQTVYVDEKYANWYENRIFRLQSGEIVAVYNDITDRKQAEEAQIASEIRYRRLFEEAKDGILILDADTGLIVEVNPFLINLLGFSREQFLGKKIWEIGLFKDIVANKDNFEELQRKEFIRYEDLPLETADGRRIAVEFLSNVYLVNNKKVIQCNIRDITERKWMESEIRSLNTVLEQRVEQRTAQLNASLDEKTVLLREVHHRVKNNFQIIISLLSLQSRSIGDEKFSRAMLESQNRIRAMAFVQETLYSSVDFTRIDLESYAKYLTAQLFTFFKVRPGTIELILDIKNIFIDINTAIPLGLVINELVSNSLKHAFPDGRKGRITIRILDGQKGLTLTYKDNGVGFLKGFDWQTTESFGFKLIRLLIDQLDGTIEQEPGEGTCFTIRVMRNTDGQGHIHGTYNPVPE